MNEKNYILVLSTCPDVTIAEYLAEKAVSQRLAACVNIVPGLTSVYQWQGKLEKDNEALLLIKTQQDRYNQLEALIQQAHPYELPEILAVSVEEGSQDYLNWITTSLEHK